MSSPVLFCPFCREAFEGVVMCPDHDLRLVPFDALEGATEPDAPDDAEAVSVHDPRLGRGLVALGAFVLLLGSAMPFVERHADERSVAPSLFALAADEATALWTVPCMASGLLIVLARARKPRTMRRLRPLIMLAALGALASVAVALLRIQRAAVALSERGEAVHLSIAVGVLAIGLGAVVVLAGALRFGRLPARPVALPTSEE